MREYGDFAFFCWWRGQPYSPWFLRYLDSSTLILLSILKPLCALSPLLFLKIIKRDKIIMYFSTITIISWFLEKGLYEPFGFIFKWLLLNLPFFWVYRAPWEKIAIMSVLSTSILFAYSMSYLMCFMSAKLARVFPCTNKNKIRTATRNLLLLILIIGYLAYHKPMVTGEILPTEEGDIGYRQYYDLSYHLLIPDYVFKACKYINNDDELIGVLILPDEKCGVYRWGYAGTADITVLLLNKYILFRQWGEGAALTMPIDRIYREIITILYEKKCKYLHNVLRLLGIKYIIQRDDFYYDLYGDNDSPSFIRSVLSFQNNISLTVSFGMWHIYKVKGEVIPRVYVAYNILIIESSLSQLVDLLASNVLIPNIDTVTLLKDNITKTLIERYFNKHRSLTLILSMNQSVRGSLFRLSEPDHKHMRILFKRVNPTKYIIYVYNASGPFVLVLNELFSTNWRVYISDLDINKEEDVLNLCKVSQVYDNTIIECEHKFFFDALDFLLLLCESIPEERHIVAWGYANGWLIIPNIDDPSHDGNFMLVITYLGQLYFYLGLVIAIGSLVMIIIVCIILRVRKA